RARRAAAACWLIAPAPWPLEQRGVRRLANIWREHGSHAAPTHRIPPRTSLDRQRAWLGLLRGHLPGCRCAQSETRRAQGILSDDLVGPRGGRPSDGGQQEV